MSLKLPDFQSIIKDKHFFIGLISGMAIAVFALMFTLQFIGVLAGLCIAIIGVKYIQKDQALKKTSQKGKTITEKVVESLTEKQKRKYTPRKPCIECGSKGPIHKKGCSKSQKA